MAQWKAVMDFMAANKRRPSKFVDEERGLRNWWKHQQKLVNAGELKPLRNCLRCVKGIGGRISGSEGIKDAER